MQNSIFPAFAAEAQNQLQAYNEAHASNEDLLKKLKEQRPILEDDFDYYDIEVEEAVRSRDEVENKLAKLDEEIEYLEEEIDKQSEITQRTW